MTSPISPKKILKTQLNMKIFKDFNEAIKAEDFAKFENVGGQVLEKIGHFNTQNKEGKTALLLVAEPVNDRFSSATLQMMNYLLKNDADPLIQDLDGNNSLHYLLRAHNSYMDIKIKMMSSLLEYGAKLDQKNEVGHLPQHLLFQVNEKISDLKMLQFLTTQGIDLDTPGRGNNTLLHNIAKNGNAEDIHFLINQGVKINPVNINGNTPLHLACIFENLKIIKVLIQAKADIHKPNHRGQTPLFSAFSKGSFKVFEYLLRKGACFELINDEGEDLFFKDSQSSVLLSDYYKKQKVLYEQKKLKKDLPQNSKKTQIPRL